MYKIESLINKGRKEQVEQFKNSQRKNLELNQIGINTPIGILTATLGGDIAYPCIDIKFNNEIVTSVEYDAESNHVRSLLYNTQDDDPEIIHEYNEGVHEEDEEVKKFSDDDLIKCAHCNGKYPYNKIIMNSVGIHYCKDCKIAIEWEISYETAKKMNKLEVNYTYPIDIIRAMATGYHGSEKQVCMAMEFGTMSLELCIEDSSSHTDYPDVYLFACKKFNEDDWESDDFTETDTALILSALKNDTEKFLEFMFNELKAFSIDKNRSWKEFNK